MHVFAENVSANRHNELMLIFLLGRLIFIPSKDEITKKYSLSDISEAQNLKGSKTGGLALLLKVKIDVRLMITTNKEVLCKKE